MKNSLFILLFATSALAAPAALFEKKNPETFRLYQNEKTPVKLELKSVHAKLALAILADASIQSPPSEVNLKGLILSRMKASPNKVHLNIVTDTEELRVQPTLDLKELRKGKWIPLSFVDKKNAQGFSIQVVTKLKIRWRRSKEQIEIFEFKSDVDVKSPIFNFKENFKFEEIKAKRAHLIRKVAYYL